VLLAGLVLAASQASAQDPGEVHERARIDSEVVEETLARAETLDRIHALIAVQNGETIIERVFRGPNLNQPVNIKSASKTVISALVGIAIDHGLLDGTDAPIVPLLSSRAPDGLDPRVATITLAHLLSMRAGLERTSGPNYGPWVVSSNWVRYALTRDFVDRPGGGWLYSTGNTHLLSAILTDASGRSTLELARDWLGEPLDFSVPSWTRDPQGIYFGGNEMALSPRALVAFGEMYRNGGVNADGERVVSREWIRDSWTPKAYGRGGQLYGYGWFISQAYGHPIYFAWGFGGQMLYVVPTLDLTVAITSDFTTMSAADGYRCALHALIDKGFVPAVISANPEKARAPFVSRGWTYPDLGGNRCSNAWFENQLPG
jgi:CubicO group peptidase (beta-lactamase class C family)